MKLGTLFALAFVAVVASCAATDEPPSETLRTQKLGADCTCPLEAQTGTCGKWTCTIGRAGNICVFDPLEDEGNKCELNGELGSCRSPSGDFKQDMICCLGCFSPGDPFRGIPGVCHTGDEPGYCGAKGLKCDECTECETCKEGACVPSTGDACGTCKVCDEGKCVDEQVGKACASGRCAQDAVCCTGCIDGNGACLSSTDNACGLGGDDCQECGQCHRCSSGSCEATTGGSCDDADPCTEGDTCGSSGCAGTPIAIDDGNECTDDACDDVDLVTHTSKPEGETCVGNGSSCGSGGWHCTDHDTDPGTARICQPVAGLTCYDSNPCTSDAPDCANNDCPYPNLPDDSSCSLGLRCVLNESCQGGTCTGEMRNCSDDNPCTTDTCEETDAADVDPVTGCKHAPKAMTTDCEDGTDCTINDHCGEDGQCTGDPKVCDAIDSCHGPGSCDPQTGNCSDPRLQDGTACDGTGVCDNGSCEGGTVPGTGGSSGAGGSGSGGSASGSSGASGGPGGDGNEAGTASSAAGSDGNPGSGGNGTGGSGSGGTESGGSSGSSGSSGSAGDTAGTFDGPLFERDPGGCSCRVGDTRAPAGNYLALVAVGGLGLALRRRRCAA